MVKKVPGLFTTFKGLWARGPKDNTPPDHFQDCLNTNSCDYEVESRSGTTRWATINQNILRMQVYKPNPPFDASNYPRVIYLIAGGTLIDSKYPSTPIFGNAGMLDFSLVNFFGRAYITFSDGRVGLNTQFICVYDGTGPSGFRSAGGASPTTPLTVALIAGSTGNFDVGTYLFSYAFETASGFVTRPATPFVAIDMLGGLSVNFTNIPIGPAGTVARWLIATKSLPLRANLGVPLDPSIAAFVPQFFQQRIGDNTTTSLTPVTFFDESLVESADYLQTQLTFIPCGVGLMEYKGRMVSFGEYSDPTKTRISEPGEPEAFSATSGFLITDPTDSSGIRSAVEFRNNLYLYKDSRGYVTQEIADVEPTGWDVVNFEKAIGTEHYGIGQILDAKGSSSEGFTIASRGGLYFFNGVLQDPELSYKIRDLWLRINKENFHKIQVAQDPINKRIYIIVPLDSSTVPSHVIFGDYREGLNPTNIKWHLWKFTPAVNCISIYEEYVNNIFNYATRVGNTSHIENIVIDGLSDDSGNNIDITFQTAPVRFTNGVSQFNDVRIRAVGPCNLGFFLMGEDRLLAPALEGLVIPTATPGREYLILSNLISEQASLFVYTTINASLCLRVNAIQIEGSAMWDERPS